jgi:large subunit ribosomal protein L35
MAKAKQKTHSGAKKRLTLLPSGKVKHKQSGMRHLLSPHKSKGKRQAGKTSYVHDANINQTRRLLNF